MDKGTAVSGIADEAADSGVIAGHWMYDEKRHGQKQRNENNCLHTKNLAPLMSDEHNSPFPYKSSLKIMLIGSNTNVAGFPAHGDFHSPLTL